MEDNTSIGRRPYADFSDSSALHGEEVCSQGRRWGEELLLTRTACPYMSIIFAGSVKNQQMIIKTSFATYLRKGCQRINILRF